MKYIIGTDFDNTLASYDAVMNAVAIQRGLIEPSTPKSKKQIRDCIRQPPDGELEWQKLQALAYGPRMNESELIDGVSEFFQLCRRNLTPIHVISHKTEFATMDSTKTNLHHTALSWMQSHGFFAESGLGLARESVHFAQTRLEKIELIKKLGCTLFIDALDETFLEVYFPANVDKILFSPRPAGHVASGARVMSSWREISRYVFGNDA